MAGNRKPRKRYKARGANCVAHALAMNAVTRLTAEELEKCAGAPERSLKAFIAGDDPPLHWSVMVDALAVAEALSDIGICSDAESRLKIKCGQQALAGLHAWVVDEGFKPAEVMPVAVRGVLDDAVEIHRIQLSLCDYSEYRRAIERVMRVAAGAIAGNVSPGTTILEAP